MGKEKKKKDTNKKPYKKKYTQEDVYKAVDAVNAGTSLRTASQQFHIPRSTLHAKLNETVPIEVAKGPTTYLTFKEELLLWFIEWILYCGDRGFPVTKAFLLERVQKLVEKLERIIPFKDNKPGRHWYESFCRRHPEIAPRVAQNLTTKRVSVTTLADPCDQLHSGYFMVSGSFWVRPGPF